MMLQCLKSYVIRPTSGNVSIYISYKFEMYIFKIALIIKINVYFAFQYVLSKAYR